MYHEGLKENMADSDNSTRPSRIVREGSVGLFILLGMALFGSLVFWLKGFVLGEQGFRFTVEFLDAAGLKVGSVVRFRGVAVGRIERIQPSLNGVEAELVITTSSLVIPKLVTITSNQSGLIGEAIIDITPLQTLSNQPIAGPRDAQCNPEIIVCEGVRLPGEVGVSLEAMIRSTNDFVKLVGNPQFFEELRSAVKTTSQAMDGVTTLSEDLSQLTTSIQSPTLKTIDSMGRAADKFNSAATQIDSLLRENRSELVSTLTNLSDASRETKEIVASLSPVAKRIETGDMIANLEKLALNASQASANFRDFTRTLNNPVNALKLQQTLDAARATFQNTQKITSDINELTGDAQLREKIRRIRGWAE
jgi:phospholipid/cholesterol/gamma-HCH transport system substrate-binding protein